MTGYVRQEADDIQNNKPADADKLNNEFNQIVSAMASAGGHSHSGLEGEGAYVPLIKNVSTGTQVVTGLDNVTTDIGDTPNVLIITKDIGGNPIINGVDILTESTKLETVEEGATADQTPSELKVAYESNPDTNAFTNALSTKLNGIEVGATGNQSASEIKAAYESNSNTNNFTDSLKNKLNSIPSNASADQTASEIKVAYESNSDTNAFTNALNTKLNGIESGATGNQSSSEIKVAYESNSNTNNFTDAFKNKLTNLPADASADQTASEIKAAYESNSNTNNFTDTLLAKLNSVEAGATGNQSAGDLESIINHNNLLGVSALEHLDWTVNQGSNNINANNYVNTTYAVGDGGLTEKNFTTALKTKLSGIATGANAYSHPTHPGDDLSVDTSALTGATVISDLDFNVTTDTLGHVTDANASVSTRDLTAANVGAAPAGGSTATSWNCKALTMAGALTGATSITSTGNITAYSDERLKHDLKKIPDALAKVLSISGYTYDRVDGEYERQMGVSAQEIQQVAPEAVEVDELGFLKVAYGNLAALFIEAIKELNAKVERLEEDGS